MAPEEAVDVECVIVGGGISGICMAAHLLSAGRKSFLVLEKYGDVGGTWAYNRYPGCRCDVPSHLYCYSFHPSADWTESYAPRAQIHSYLRHCVKDHNLLPHFRFRTTLVSAVWEDANALWKLALRTAENGGEADSGVLSTLRSRFLIRATGPGLHIPRLPSAKGAADGTFAGTSLHSSQWDPDLDLRGKVVAVVGTGASAVQIIPAIAPIAKKLIVCQRTPAWVVPVLHIGVPPAVRRVFHYFPVLVLLLRYVEYCIQELMFSSQFFGIYLRYFGAVFPWALRQLIRRSVADPNISAALTPTYTFGCKRALMSNTFYKTFARPNVRLLAGSLTEVRRHSLVVKENATQKEVEAEVEVIIYATGFDACAEAFEVVGRGGVRLSDAGHETMLGIVKHGFPNFFMLLGPNTTLGHNSLILMAEAQARYIVKCVQMAAGRGLRAMEVTAEAQRRFQKLLDRMFPNTVWKAGNCLSWYVHPITGKNHVIWPGSTLDYFRRTGSVSLTDFHITS